MKLLYLEIEGFKRIVVAKIKRAGNVMNITGKNGQGKTSVMDAIETLMGGKDAAPAVPVHLGADRALIRGHLGEKEVELVVTRIFEHDADGEIKHQLKVTRPEGNKREARGQSLLDEFYGVLSFDAAAFLGMKPPAQVQLVARLAGIDIDKINDLNAKDYEARTEINRDAKKLEARIAGAVVPAGTPEKSVDVADLVLKISEAGKHNAQIAARKKRREDVRERITNLLQMIEDFEAKNVERQADIVKLQELIASTTAENAARAKEIADLDAKLKAAPPLPAESDASILSQQLTHATAINDAVRIRQTRDTEREELKELLENSEKLTAAREARIEMMREKIAAAKLPVEGLELTDKGLLLNKLPFDQASYAQQLKASTAIGMRLNPKFRVILIREASALDQESKRVVYDLARAEDYDVWMETVSEGKPDAESFVIEDGLLLEEPHPVLGVSKPT